MKSAINVGLFTGALISETPIPGQITVANSSAYEAANLSQALTAYIAGQPAPDLEKVLDELFPAVEAGRFFEFQKHADDAFSEKLRAIQTFHDTPLQLAVRLLPRLPPHRKPPRVMRKIQ